MPSAQQPGLSTDPSFALCYNTGSASRSWQSEERPIHFIDLTIQEIVHVDGQPSHARGSAVFSNGYIFEFHANFDYPDDYAIAIIPPPQPGAFQPHSEHAAEIIHVELGFDEIFDRQHAAMASRKHKRDTIESFRRERIAACRKFMPADTS